MEACAMNGTLFPDSRQGILELDDMFPEDVYFAGKNRQEYELLKLSRKFFAVLRKIFG